MPENKAIFVAGGAGFIGSALVRALVERSPDARVVVFDNFAHGRRENLDGVACTIVEGDVLDAHALDDAFAAHRPDVVFDLVSETYVPTAYALPRRFLRTNVEGTLNLLQASKSFDVRKMIYASTTEVYGEASGALDEKQPFSPLNTYAVTKAAADRLCATFVEEHRVPVVIARLFNGYGPRATHPYVIPEIITQLSKGSRVVLGNVEARRDFTYVDDVARALIAIADADVAPGEVFNVGSDQCVGVRELVSIVGELFERKDVRIDVDSSRFRRHDIDSFRCDARKLQRATGWKPTVELRAGLRRTIEWFRAHGGQWSWELDYEKRIRIADAR